MKRVLITGGTGLLGKALVETKGGACFVVATYKGNYKMNDTAQIEYRELDIVDKDGYKKLFEEVKPEVVIHTASIGSPDYSEQHQEETWQINVGGTINICELCNDFEANLVYVSSNGIYDGKNAPYSEENKAIPINYYGKVKLEGENIVKKVKNPYAIVRPILMYGWNYPYERANIITITLSKLHKGENVYAYKDVFSNPLLSTSCAQAIWKIIMEEKYDVYNIAGENIVSIYEFVCKAAEIFGLNKDLIKPVTQGFFNELVRRPTNTSYRTDKMEARLKLKPLSLSEGLQVMRDELLKGEGF